MYGDEKRSINNKRRGGNAFGMITPDRVIQTCGGSGNGYASTKLPNGIYCYDGMYVYESSYEYSKVREYGPVQEYKIHTYPYDNYMDKTKKKPARQITERNEGRRQADKPRPKKKTSFDQNRVAPQPAATEQQKPAKSDSKNQAPPPTTNPTTQGQPRKQDSVAPVNEPRDDRPTAAKPATVAAAAVVAENHHQQPVTNKQANDGNVVVVAAAAVAAGSSKPDQPQRSGHHMVKSMARSMDLYRH